MSSVDELERLARFDYLLTAFEHASHAEQPVLHDYAGKRRAMFAYVRDLERRSLASSMAQPASAPSVDELMRAVCTYGGSMYANGVDWKHSRMSRADPDLAHIRSLASSMAQPSSQDIAAQAAREQREMDLALIPTNWLDPLLTGPNAVIGKPPYQCSDIEALLRAVSAAILAQEQERVK